MPGMDGKLSNTPVANKSLRVRTDAAPAIFTLSPLAPRRGFTGSHLRLTPSEAHPEPHSDCQAGRSGGEPEGMGNTLQAYDYVNIAAERQRQ
jgi:hypothetical protein